jgi:hypothetical protein
MGSTRAAVCILESLSFLDEDGHREGEIVSRTLRMSDVPVHYSYVRTSDEMEAFFKEFGASDFRYLHISCHGSKDAFHASTEDIPTEVFAGMLAPHLRGRRLFLSACLAGNSKFAKALIPSTGCLSILAPEDSIRFDDAAIFWTTFYHLRFKANSDRMVRADVIDTAKTCAKLIDERFRFFYLKGDAFGQKWLGSRSS